MNIKRAIGIIFVLFIAVHTSSVIGSKSLGIDLETADPANMPPAMWYFAFISVIVLSTAGVFWFFKSPKTVPSAKNGFLFGLMAVAFGFVMDIFLLVRLENGTELLLKYFAQPQFWTGLVLIPVICTLVGYIKAKK